MKRLMRCSVVLAFLLSLGMAAPSQATCRPSIFVKFGGNYWECFLSGEGNGMCWYDNCVCLSCP
jgi:hypothetical protein